MVEVEIQEGEVADTIAAVKYIDLDCGGTWRLYRASQDKIVVDELIDYGSCIDVSITLTKEGDKLDYAVESPSVLGKLKKSALTP